MQEERCKADLEDSAEEAQDEKAKYRLNSMEILRNVGEDSEERNSVSSKFSIEKVEWGLLQFWLKIEIQMIPGKL